MSDYRKAYLEARDEIAKGLIAKYNLKESYKDNNRLTLDSSKHSIHLTFYIPDGEGVSISEKGKEPGFGYSFMELLHKQYKDINIMTHAYQEISKIKEEYNPNSSPVYLNLMVMLSFIENTYPNYFN